MAMFVFWYEYLVEAAIFHVPILVIYPIMMTGYVLAYTKYHLINRFNAQMSVGNTQQQNGDRCLALFGAHQHSSTALVVRLVQPSVQIQRSVF